MSYDVIVGEEIRFEADGDVEKGGNSITSANFKMNTLNDDTRNRSNSVRCEVMIEGKINPANREETKKLTQWAMDRNSATIYRKLDIVVYDGEEGKGDVVRRYSAENMFVIDYEEEFGKDLEETGGTFKLFLAQKEGINNIEVYSN